MTNTAWQIAVVGAGPVGLALALHAARLLPHASITLHDARPADRDVGGDPRTLALSLGSVQFLRRIGAWPAAAAEPIAQVHVSQAPPAPATPLGEPAVRLSAADAGVPMLGAVLPYGALVAPLQRAWEAEVAAQPHRLRSRFGAAVEAIETAGDGVEVRAGGRVDRHDLAVVAEGSVLGDTARQAVAGDYGQTAWVGRVTLRGATRGVAFERFTRDGPAALLPLPPGSDDAAATASGDLPAALVWCVPTVDDPVARLDDAQRAAVLNTVFPREAGRVVAVSPLKAFPLALAAERTLVRGATVRIGNAAQTLHPVAGQGLNLGLRDAHALVAALRHAERLEPALRRVEWARAADRWSMIAATDFLARSFTWKLPGAATARGLGLAALQAAPPLRGWLARRMMFGSR